MPRYYINGRFLSQPRSGVQRFAEEISVQLTSELKDIEILVPRGIQKPPKELRPFLKTIGRNRRTLWEQLDLCLYMRKKGGLLLNLCNTAPLFYSQCVITIHDLAVYENPSWFKMSFSLWYKFLLPRITAKAILIFTVSEFSKSEIKKYLPADESKIFITYNGVGRHLERPVQEKKSRENIFLHVGTLSDRKNVDLIVKAFRNANTSESKLILVGNRDENISYLASSTRNDNIIIKSGLKDEEISELYDDAKFFICASNYEGFGIPVLEALYKGLITIVSDIPAFSELYDGHVIFFQRNNLKDLKNVIENGIAHSLNNQLKEE
ncbi:MAG: glycosyltransferase family 4 protein, partial [Flavobacteriales bacterium]|nr:glycosyltransferase family 4 protein [Flavobacteriales bacterium]